MLRATYFALTLAVAGLLALGCSGQATDYATTPNITDATANSINHDSQRLLWRIWNISFDPNEMVVSIDPIRNPQAHFNITNMITPPECSDCLEIHVNSFDPVTRIMDVDVTLKNPTTLGGYDVRGILYTNDYGHELRNADDWTGLWDIPGGTVLNPFKAFAKDEPNRTFGGEAEHTEKYLVYIPQPPHYSDITFAVDVSWPGNCKEPYEITNFWQEPVYDALGSSGKIYIDVRDWQFDVSKVTLVAPEITGEDFTLFSHLSGDTWQMTLVNNTGAAPGNYECRIIANSFNAGDTTLYDYIAITISQDPDGGWAKTWGGIYSDSASGVAIDGSGNAYITGGFYDIADFDPGPEVDEYTSNGGWDISLSKFNSSGDFLWARTWGGIYGDFGNEVAIDGSGNAYITGSFRDTVDFDPGPGVDEHISNSGYAIFLSKFDSSGSFLWARTWGGGGYWDSGSGVAIDGSGNAYITGGFFDTVDFDPGPGVDEHTAGAYGYPDVFLSKFDSSGNFQWARTWGREGYSDSGSGVAIDGSGNAYVTGRFFGTVDFDPSPGVDEHTSVGSYDIFLSKFDSTGEYQWARTWGAGGEDDIGFEVAIDGNGNAYVTGRFSGTADFDPGPGVDEQGLYGGVFLSKFDSSGDFQWARTWGRGSGFGVAIDEGNNAYVTGDFGGTVDFDPGPGVDEHTSIAGDSDIFLSKFDSTGNFQWARTWGWWDVDYGFGVAIDGSGNAYVTGSFRETVDFDPGLGVDEHASNGGSDIFLSKFPPDGNW